MIRMFSCRSNIRQHMHITAVERSPGVEKTHAAGRVSTDLQENKMNARKNYAFAFPST